MKKLIPLVLVLFAAACTKDVLPDVSTFGEFADVSAIDDSNPDDGGELVTLESFANGSTLRAGAIKITSASCKNVVGAASTCEKYPLYAKLIVGDTTQFGTEFVLRDTAKNFGSTQGTKIVEAEIVSGQVAKPCQVVSWADSSISIRIPKVASKLKNVTIKIRVKESSAANARTTTASFKSVPWYDGNVNVWYGHNRWDAASVDSLRPKLAIAARDLISASWTPAKGQLVFRADSSKTMGLITNVLDETKIVAGQPVYKTTLTITERNLGCDGMVKTKKYDMDQNAHNLTLKSTTAESPWLKVAE